MADTKLSSLSAASTLATTDKIYVVQTDGQGGLRATLAQLPGVYGGIYVSEGSTAQSISTGTTPTLLTCFNTAAGANGLSSNCTPAKASNKITVTIAGTYRIAYQISYLSGTANATWEFYAFNDGTASASTGSMTKNSTNTDYQSVSGVGFATVAANKDIDLRGYHDAVGSVNITVAHANLTVQRIGP